MHVIDIVVKNNVKPADARADDMKAKMDIIGHGVTKSVTKLGKIGVTKSKK